MELVNIFIPVWIENLEADDLELFAQHFLALKKCLIKNSSRRVSGLSIRARKFLI